MKDDVCSTNPSCGSNTGAHLQLVAWSLVTDAIFMSRLAWKCTEFTAAPSASSLAYIQVVAFRTFRNQLYFALRNSVLNSADL